MSLVTAALDNPDVAALITAGASYLGRILWKKGKKAQIDDLWETLLQVGRQAFPVLWKSARLYDDAYVRETISKTIWAGLTRLSIPKNETTMKLVDEAVEHVVGELAAMVMKYHLGQLEKPLKATLEDLKKLPGEVPIVEPGA